MAPCKSIDSWSFPRLKGEQQKGGREEREEDGFGSYKEDKARTADIGWQMPGNTFNEGKKF